jgi:putative transposase
MAMRPYHIVHVKWGGIYTRAERAGCRTRWTESNTGAHCHVPLRASPRAQTDMKYDPEIHNRRSIRLRGYDYSSPSAYFITICTHQKEFLLGRVLNGQMYRNTYGEIAEEEWFRSAAIRKEIQLDAWMVMPNHVHGIVMINPVVGAHGNVGAHRHVPLQVPARRPRSLATFVGGFKGAVNRRINEMRRTPGAPVWQDNYYEHVVRNEDELARIREYIMTNPLRWMYDRENPERQPMNPEENPDWYA